MKNKINKLTASVLIVGSIILVGSLWEKLCTEQYLFKTVNIALDYPKKAKVEVVKDDRAIVDEHVKFEISDKKFEEDLVIDFLIVNDFVVECVEMDPNSSILKDGNAHAGYSYTVKENSSSKESPQKMHEFCGYFERLVDCKISEKVSSYCPYYDENYISKTKEDSITQRFGPVFGYTSDTNHWKKAPDNFSGLWPEGKTRKTYIPFIFSKNHTMNDKKIYIIAWFKTGDKIAENTADKIVRHRINVLK